LKMLKISPVTIPTKSAINTSDILNPYVK